MGTFVYEGLRAGRKVSGKIEAQDRSQALRKLKEQGIVPLSLEPEGKGWAFGLKFSFRRISEEDISFTLIQLAVLLRSGIPLTKALQLVASQTENKHLSSALLHIKEDIDRGEGISSAFKKAGVFPEFLPQMLAAAETGENLESIFETAGEHLKTVSEMKAKIISSVTYPAVVIGFSLIAFFVAIKLVVPKIAGVLESFGKELPLVTKLIIFGADVITYLFYASPLLLVLFIKRERVFGRERLHRLLLRAPLVGKIALFFDLSRFAYTLKMTLSAAVPITTAYRISVASIGNAYIRKKLLDLQQEIERGKSLSSVLRSTGLFPELFLNLVETGEASGELEKMLSLLAQLYRREALKAIDFWIRMVEPLSLLIIGVIVGIIVVSIILPLTEITAGVGR